MIAYNKFIQDLQNQIPIMFNGNAIVYVNPNKILYRTFEYKSVQDFYNKYNLDNSIYYRSKHLLSRKE